MPLSKEIKSNWTNPNKTKQNLSHANDIYTIMGLEELQAIMGFQAFQ